MLFGEDGAFFILFSILLSTLVSKTTSLPSKIENNSLTAFFNLKKISNLK